MAMLNIKAVFLWPNYLWAYLNISINDNHGLAAAVSALLLAPISDFQQRDCVKCLTKQHKFIRIYLDKLMKNALFNVKIIIKK